MSSPTRAPTHALLEVLSLDCAPDDDMTNPVNVLKVGSEQELKDFLADYEPRYEKASKEWSEFDNSTRGQEWSKDHDAKFDEIFNRHDVVGFVPDSMFKIVQIDYA